jgi:tRNA (adenine22-N1)-methyltransferase
MKEFVQYKLEKYTQIYNSLNEDTPSSKDRKKQLYDVTSRLKEFLECF